MGVSFKAQEGQEVDLHAARSVRDEMLKRGVWAICEFERQVRMYPALNMDEAVLLRGLGLMEESIDQVQRHGVTVGDHPPHAKRAWWGFEMAESFSHVDVGGNCRREPFEVRQRFVADRPHNFPVDGVVVVDGDVPEADSLLHRFAGRRRNRP